MRCTFSSAKKSTTLRYDKKHVFLTTFEVTGMKNALLKEARNIQSYAFLDLIQYNIFFVRTAMKCKKT